MSDNGEANGQRETSERLWVLVNLDALPERWKGRAVPLALVGLLPEEARQFIKGEIPRAKLDRDDDELARLAARGVAVDDIADALHLTSRSVYRRLARLRRQFDARTNAELASRLTKFGF